MFIGRCSELAEKYNNCPSAMVFILTGLEQLFVLEIPIALISEQEFVAFEYHTRCFNKMYFILMLNF